ncbi:MAG: hypothetical protein DMF63_18835 [Acidobacteria bacterium]|nr:MAG: hypothetical protein DMF63_18835 [Acidobacteriota bacterium]
MISYANLADQADQDGSEKIISRFHPLDPPDPRSKKACAVGVTSRPRVHDFVRRMRDKKGVSKKLTPLVWAWKCSDALVATPKGIG